MAGRVWVLAEQWRGKVSEITFEVLALGREIADEQGAQLQALLLGEGVRELAEKLGKADSVLYVSHPTLKEPVPEIYAQVLAGLITEHRPLCLLVPLTNITHGVASLLAARLGLPLVNFCSDLKAVEAGLQARCVLYGGKIEADVGIQSHPAIVCMWPGARHAEGGRSDRIPDIQDVSVSLPTTPNIQFNGYLEPAADSVDISKQDVLLAIGRGIQNQETLGLAKELAGALGGVLCGSRPVIDQGWLPLSRQVGKSGATVKPKLYISAGISGAPEHVEGMKDSSLIVAINTDPKAPIFNVAHYGIVGDVQDFLPALTEAVRAKTG